ncbi:glycosyltransferase [Proteus mirabilis]|uniref:glycosyltransferase n=7 Tax=Proteus mirabilis TaxID=584 RepID=UPI000789FFCA|nr:glycosyltransferase [Proteus mirabilis]MBA7798049.1 glycosyltransferase [Citrobacter sp. RHBSTW-01065]EKX5075141.1 glycosyltransferase [Proteus mirabilis]ELB2727207.1 glycosyltransferase [Proteus mirabilis]ELN3979012.1 glycosyltransferase [Proteus mirabilis]EMA4641420.1 glycosyltransferase [Proteus mirabilis]
MKRILIITNYYFPAKKAGGPVKSIKNLVSFLKEKYSFNIITSNRDLDGAILNTKNSEDISYTKNTYEIIYLLLKKINNVDIIYLNSFFSFKYSILILVLNSLGLCKNKKILIAPRGELSNGAVSIKKRKKIFYIRCFKYFLKRKNISFHFTTVEEKNEAIAMLGNIKHKVAPNCHDKIPAYIKKKKERNELKIIYLSRITPKKNLLILSKILSEINSNIQFTIVGNIEDSSYFKECMLILNKNKLITTKYIGAVSPEKTSTLLQDSHLFALLTLNENYGHAIVEALTHSNLVLLSNNTPWSNLSNYNCGIFDPDSIDECKLYINKIFEMDQIEYNQYTYRTYQYISNILSINEKFIEETFSD